MHAWRLTGERGAVPSARGSSRTTSDDFDESGQGAGGKGAVAGGNSGVPWPVRVRPHDEAARCRLLSTSGGPGAPFCTPQVWHTARMTGMHVHTGLLQASPAVPGWEAGLVRQHRWQGTWLRHHAAGVAGMADAVRHGRRFGEIANAHFICSMSPPTDNVLCTDIQWLPIATRPPG